jgi:hypothetical protein
MRHVLFVVPCPVSREVNFHQAVCSVSLIDTTYTATPSEFKKLIYESKANYREFIVSKKSLDVCVNVRREFAMQQYSDTALQLTKMKIFILICGFHFDMGFPPALCI